MTTIIAEFVAAADRCEGAARRFDDGALRELEGRLREAIGAVAKSWSGSWLGYHSRVYLKGFRARRPGDTWSTEWGGVQRSSNPLSGDWCEVDPQHVIDTIDRLANLPLDKLEPLQQAAAEAGRVFDEVKQDLLPLLDALLAQAEEPVVRKTRDEISSLDSHIPADAFTSSLVPQEIGSRDARAIGEGIRVPPHILCEARLDQLLSFGHHAGTLGKKVRYLQKYLELKDRVGRDHSTSHGQPRKVSASVEGTMNFIKVFISHSANDSTLAKAFVDCLEACLEVPGKAIRCTSVPGYKLAPGDVSDEVLRDNLEECSVVVGLLTEQSLSSGYVLMELGAAWALKKTTCALLAPSIGFNRLPGPLARVHAIKADSDHDLASLMETIAETTGLTLANRAKSTAGINAFVRATKTIP